MAMAQPDSPGTHYPYGILIVHGKNVRPSARADARLIDVIPTLLFALDIPIPCDLDGVVLKDLLDVPREPVYEQGESVAGAAASEDHHYSYSDSDAESIEGRLRDLGYLD